MEGCKIGLILAEVQEAVNDNQRYFTESQAVPTYSDS